MTKWLGIDSTLHAFIGMGFLLDAKTKRGKQILKETGSNWYVEKVSAYLPLGRGPWFYMEPCACCFLTDDKVSEYGRWIHKFNDQHFNIIIFDK